jgi:hypothetical protein
VRVLKRPLPTSLLAEEREAVTLGQGSRTTLCKEKSIVEDGEEELRWRVELKGSDIVGSTLTLSHLCK